jgi:transposase
VRRRDLSDARWALVEPVLTAWRAERRAGALDIGRPPEHDLRDILNAILYVNRTGIPWRYLPHECPPWQTAYAFFAHWQKDGIFDQLHGLGADDGGQRDAQPLWGGGVLVPRQGRPGSPGRPRGAAERLHVHERGPLPLAEGDRQVHASIGRASP